MTAEADCGELPRPGRPPVALEYAWVGAARSRHPPVVFLHEGLGSLALWKDFPATFCDAHGLRGLVYSREGYGRSTPRPPGERWPVTYMHRQAFEALPALLEALGVRKPWLFGHSDGASIALLHASRHPVAGLVLLAPHLFTEACGLASIEAARVAYETTDLRTRLARYHADVDSAFRGWNDIWLDPAFRAWNIEDALGAIRVPVLAVQGEDDEYGTLEQLAALRRRVPHAELLVLPACGHSAHRDQPERVIETAGAFIRRAGGEAV